ncbi:2-amino-4-hydroxy-6-hydroxymethyldihydropteridinepyrophosphokinase [hydrothermal vent metagenome]|uniref:2-amino-4-hydroxy-6-hydroxymethyldihydropteridine diphosphokinase n=1 Tax=hydrothermal vent metagenome TaxID=652676 RepID=A0A3B1D1N6_9ZZZZ
MQIAFIGIGSNIGNRLQFCQKAVAALQQHPEIHLKKISSLYETAPVDFLEQDYFYNAVVSIKTSLSPEQLLGACQEIEVRSGKKIVISKGPRTLDLDLLFYGQVILNTPDLILPHPEITRRLFVLIPLAEIAPDCMHPVKSCSMRTLLSAFQPDEFKTVDLRFETAWEKIPLESKTA